MDNTVNLITTSLSIPNLWDIVFFIIPIIAISVLFGLGFYLIKTITKSFSIPTSSPLGGSSDSSSFEDYDDLSELRWEYKHRNEIDGSDEFWDN